MSQAFATAGEERQAERLANIAAGLAAGAALAAIVVKAEKGRARISWLGLVVSTVCGVLCCIDLVVRDSAPLVGVVVLAAAIISLLTWPEGDA